MSSFKLVLCVLSDNKSDFLEGFKATFETNGAFQHITFS